MINVKAYIEELAARYKYRPLPKKIRAEVYELYNNNLNGFDKEREVRIDGILFCDKYERIVVGDYGAYIEIAEDNLLQRLNVPFKQRWRYNTEYIESKGLTIKYYWLEYAGRKVYHQIDTVKYADYKAGKYYISVLDIDPV